MKITKEFREWVKKVHNFSSTSNDENSEKFEDWHWYMKIEYPYEVCVAIDHSEEVEEWFDDEEGYEVSESIKP